MAGLLQYNFFPTDFFYPRPPAATRDSKPAVVHMRTEKENPEDDHVEKLIKLSTTNQYKMQQENRLPQLSASLATVPSPCLITTLDQPHKMFDDI
ncbi:conserved hypothetical protein [Ricinus communis]|uniref:Uncharacterized protein n=1 Tax=Ricinus communis TaxID=3988 RepID=B9SVR6_RICCO|nr:conserved hypothetical protein [Ricinus communis]